MRRWCTAPQPGVVVGPQQFALSGGVDTGALTGPTVIGIRANKTGMFALEDVNLFNILCLPVAVELAFKLPRLVPAAVRATT